MTTTDDQAPKILDVPIGLDATGMRREFDSLGDVEVPANRYWGAQTQRSLQHFNIGNDRMPKEVYHAYGYVKKTALIGRPEDEITAGITTTVVLVVAELSPQEAWRQPILRLADTVIFGLVAAWLGLRAIRPLIRPPESPSANR